MPWVVDTCVLIDVAEADPVFGEKSAALLDRLAGDGLVVCPVSYVELGPVFAGDAAGQDFFLNGLGVSWMEPWTAADSRLAREIWTQHVLRRRSGLARRRPVADVLIGAFAQRFQGLITRNEADFQNLVPSLKVLSPS